MNSNHVRQNSLPVDSTNLLVPVLADNREERSDLVSNGEVLPNRVTNSPGEARESTNGRRRDASRVESRNSRGEQFTSPEGTERIVAAAILQDGVVFTGTRHGFIIRDIVLMTGTKPVTGQQGFVTSMGYFVSREIAGEIALRAGQVRSLKYSRTQLFSEDVWDIPSVTEGSNSDDASSNPK